jgi:cytoskeletal protein RodZ
MSNEELKKFSEDLKKSREDKQITIQEISNVTRIDEKFIKAIEDADFQVLPEVYIRAFIKEYAKTLELDPQKVIKKYENAKLGKTEESAGEEEKSEEEGEESQESENSEEDSPEQEKKVFYAAPDNSAFVSAQNKKSKKNIYFTIGAVVIIILVVVYFVFLDTPEDKIITEKSYEEQVDESGKEENRFQLDEEGDTQEEQQAVNSDKFSLGITAKDTTWCKVIIDERVAEDFILYPDRKKQFEGRKIILKVGNAGGIELLKNGEPLEFEGEKGQVRQVTITSEGIQKENTN